MTDGLVLLSDDAGCKVMLEAHNPDQYYPEGLVVDMYTENVDTELLQDVEPVEVLPPEPEGDSSEEQSDGDPENAGQNDAEEQIVTKVDADSDYKGKGKQVDVTSILMTAGQAVIQMIKTMCSH